MEDFISERSDQEGTHAQFLTDLQGKCELLQQELAEREQILVEAQMEHHILQQSHITVVHDLEESQKVLLIIRIYIMWLYIIENCGIIEER